MPGSASRPRFTAIIGLEQYSTNLWHGIRETLADEIELTQWSDDDLEAQNPATAEAIRNADCLFISRIQFIEQVEWLTEQLGPARGEGKTIFVYESMPEATQLTRVGRYVVKGGGGGGMPSMVKKVAKLLVRGRDEDALYGYTKLMRIMRSVLPLVPNKARDFKHWLQVFAYWSQPTAENICNMFRLIHREYFDGTGEVGKVVDVPTMGLYHPDAPDYFSDVKSYKRWAKKRGVDLARGQTVALLFFRKHLLQERGYIDDTIRRLEAAGIALLPGFVMGIEGHVMVRDWFMRERPELLVNMMGFGLVGGPAASTKPGAAMAARDAIMAELDAPYMVAQPLLIQDFAAWDQTGMSPVQASFTYAIPEMDGAIAPVTIGALHEGGLRTVPDRLDRLVEVVQSQLRLRATPRAERKLAFIVYDYPPGLGRKATAALLDVPASLLATLQRLKAEGYDTDELPESAEALYRLIDETTDAARQQGRREALTLDREAFKALTTAEERERVEARWGGFPGDIAPVGGDAVFLGGLRFGKVFIGVQPRIGVQGDPMRLVFDREETPHHQYLGFYRWIAREFGAHAMVHVGMHGSAEWMPGLQTALTASCWPDRMLGETPQVYLYPSNNPSEAAIARRRGLATIVSHLVPPLSRAGLYKELPALKDLLADWRERGGGEDDAATVEAAVMQKAELLNLTDDCPRREGEAFADYAGRLYGYLQELENRLISNSLHVFGNASPPEAQFVTLSETLKNRQLGEETLATLLLRLGGRLADFGDYEGLMRRARQGEAKALAAREWLEPACEQFIRDCVLGETAPAACVERLTGSPPPEESLETLATLVTEGHALLAALRDNTGELNALVHALDGGHLPSGPGGDLVRDGAAILPTGRNLHSIDTWRIPSELAFRRGAAIADQLVARHREEHAGAWPETIAQVLWGLDTIKTKGEAIAVIIRLVGGEPVYDGVGKISRYALIPLEQLGRPRIDVLIKLSSIFRDSFGILMDQLDKLVRDAALADEPHEMNYVKKHVDALVAAGESFENATARQFTQAPGTYGNYVDDMVSDSAWESEDDLDALFIRRNASAYGGKRRGEKLTGVLENLLGSVDRVVHQVDSTEFGVSDIENYFSSSGSLQLAARRRNTRNTDIRLNYVETLTADVRIDDAQQTLRMEYRSKLLNPKWYEGMLASGQGGATEISNRVTYMLGWSAMTRGVDDWVYAKTAETFALDVTMRERLTALNPKAMRNIVGRMLEANGRGLWNADPAIIDQLQEIYADLEDRIEVGEAA
ncbi:MAG: magnesium chelatase subunit H [Gammaproteobacteria bacterium]|nr:MAG: magnesium chelatase subunit H [Gammaproteobacteria bacterium]